MSEAASRARAVSLREKLARIDETWSPRIVASLNDYHVKLAQLEGEFVWHSHVDTDELFLVVDGVLELQLRDGSVWLGPGELYVVPRGVEHCPKTHGRCSVMLIEPAGTVNTGDAGGERTAPSDRWI
jgi:mannose-6-phosphate isomerase-like protein (cupin superfamily)